MKRRVIIFSLVATVLNLPSTLAASGTVYLSGIHVTANYGSLPRISGVSGQIPKAVIGRDIVVGSGAAVQEDSVVGYQESVYDWKT